MKLRYRVFDYKLRQYADPEHVGIDGDGVLWNSWAQVKLDPLRFSAEPCSGLRDQKGKLAYDSDIIEINGSMWLVTYVEANAGFSLAGFNEVQGKIAHAFHMNMGTIVGNLHDDLSLLKKEISA